MYTCPVQWAELYETTAGQAAAAASRPLSLSLHIGNRRSRAGQNLATRAPSWVMDGRLGRNWMEGWMDESVAALSPSSCHSCATMSHKFTSSCDTKKFKKERIALKIKPHQHRCLCPGSSLLSLAPSRPPTSARAHRDRIPD